MKVQHKTSCFIALFLTFSSCKVTDRTKFSIVKIDSTINPILISIDDLAKSYKKLHGQFIETSGRYFSSDENFSISTEGDSLTGKIRRFWLDIDPRLKLTKTVDKMNGEKIKIKGIVDTTFNGHMGQYLATISKIYFWELQ